jgi:prepilin signal peptidase PulO-like enzyme (type II secretory pathway)
VAARPVSDYRTLLDCTSEVLAVRAERFRNLVISVAVVTLLSVAGAATLLSLRPLSGLLLLVPAYGTFLWRDSWVLERWRAQLGDAWAREGIDFRGFRQALKANPVLPPGSVQGMLATLPEAGDLSSEQAVEAGTRQAVVVALGARDDCHTSALACRAAAYAIGAGAVVAAIVLWAWAPLLALGLVPVLAIGCGWRRGRRMTRAVQTLQGLRARRDFDLERYRAIVGALDAQGLSARGRERLIALR